MSEMTLNEARELSKKIYNEEAPGIDYRDWLESLGLEEVLNYNYYGGEPKERIAHKLVLASLRTPVPVAPPNNALPEAEEVKNTLQAKRASFASTKHSGSINASAVANALASVSNKGGRRSFKKRSNKKRRRTQRRRTYR